MLKDISKSGVFDDENVFGRVEGKATQDSGPRGFWKQKCRNKAVLLGLRRRYPKGRCGLHGKKLSAVSVSALSLTLLACGGHYSVRPGQNVAVSLVWETIYGQRNYAPPPVQWNTSDCGDGLGFMGNASGYSSPVCLYGRYNNPPEDYIELGPLPDGFFSHGSLAHELNHARLKYNYGDADPNHLGVSWYACGSGAPTAECGLVNSANSALASQGL